MVLHVQIYQQNDGKEEGVPPKAISQVRLGNYTAALLPRDAAMA